MLSDLPRAIKWQSWDSGPHCLACTKSNPRQRSQQRAGREGPVGCSTRRVRGALLLFPAFILLSGLFRTGRTRNQKSERCLGF